MTYDLMLCVLPRELKSREADATRDSRKLSRLETARFAPALKNKRLQD